MNNIVEESNRLGVSLVGWVECHDCGSFSIARHASNGEDISISCVNDEFWVWSRIEGYVFPATKSLNQALVDADSRAESYGGWAPAPIGYGLCEWLTEAIAEVDKLWDEAYNNDIGSPYSAHYYGQKQAYDKCLDILKRFQPAPPEVKG
jgi:hypothetical protein